MTIFSKTTEFEIPTADFDQFIEKYKLIDKEVLDVGCRTGEFVNYMRRRGVNARGFDLDATCIETAKERYPTYADFFSVSDLTDYLPKKQRFDVILCVGVMNYIPQKKWDFCLRHMASLLKDDGVLMVTFTKDSLLKWPIKSLSLFTCRFYGTVVAPIITFLAFPLQKYLLSIPVSRRHFHYKFSLGLYGLHIGVPLNLNAYRIDDINNSLITDKTAVYELSCNYPGKSGVIDKT